MNPAPLPQPAPFTCSHCGAALTEIPALCAKCGELVGTPRRVQRQTAPRRIASFSALLVLSSAAIVTVGALLIVTGGFSSIRFPPSSLAPVLLAAIVAVGGLFAFLFLFLRREK